jgi:hypothetical protein
MAFDYAMAGGSDYTPRAKPGICAQAKELKDKSGNYLKTVCMVSPSYTYASSESQCLANGMTLFTIESAAEQTALLEYSESFFASYANPVLWINGRKDASGKWTSTNPTKPLFSGMRWTSGTATPTEPGNCLMVGANAPNAPFYVQPKNCEDGHWFYCEYA